MISTHWMNHATNDFRLKAGSNLNTRGHDGRQMGANVTTINTAIANIR
jgi:hypothetical protein